MTREPQSTRKPRLFRADGNSLIFHNSDRQNARQPATRLAPGATFAQSGHTASLKQLVSAADNRPASQPGAD